jgi:hypothetical protein
VAAPHGLTLERHRDLTGRARSLWWRRGFLGLIALFCFAGLANVFGQAPDISTVHSPVADLETKAPPNLRGGLFYGVRFEVSAIHELENARIVLGSGWFEGITVNTIEPGPVGEASRDGDVSFELGHVPAGERHILWLQAQVNPTTFSRRDATVELYDGETRLASETRTLTIYP